MPPKKKVRALDQSRSWHFPGLFAPPFTIPDQPPAATSSLPKNEATGIFNWDIIAVTADEQEHAEACAHYLTSKLLGSKGAKPHILAVSNPGGYQIGSGGATLHALVTVVEYLSARAGDSYINSARLEGKTILIFHSGGCGTAAWLPVPFLDATGQPMANFDLLFAALSSGAASEAKTQGSSSTKGGGVWVCNATLVIAYQLIHSLGQLDWSQPGITLLAAPCSVGVGAQNGVYRLGERVEMSSAWRAHGLTYLSPAEELNADYFLPELGGVAMACGLALIDHTAAAAFLELHTVAPFNSCTVYGVDDGLTPTPFSFLLDVIRPLFLLANSTSSSPSSPSSSSSSSSAAAPPITCPFATQLRQTSLGRLPIQVVLPPSPVDTVDYVSLPRYMRSLVHDDSQNVLALNSIVEGSGSMGSRSVLVNSVMRGKWNVGAGSVACGIRSFPDLQIGDQLVAQELHLQNGSLVLTIHGKADNITVPEGTFFGDSLARFLERTGLQPSELWGEDTPNSSRTFATARLFVPLLPSAVSRFASSLFWFVHEQDYSGVALNWWRQQHRFSLQEALTKASMQREFAWMQEVEFRIDAHQVSTALLGRTNTCLLPQYNRCAQRDHRDIFPVLDQLAAEAPTDVAARAMAHIADVLAAFARGKGGLRSGPARNQEWVSHLNQLSEEANRPAVVAALAELRGRWMRDPELLIRAARHYEGAAQKLISNSVWTASQFIELGKTQPPPCEAWVRASTPLRIDLAGGWTDTPPLAFEHGGVVTNLAITIDGERPIRARARSLTEPTLIFVVGETRVQCREMKDLADYGMPSAPAALLKVCVLCLGLVDVHSPLPLAEQLRANNQGRGLELHSWSHVPTGSGLGTSSILAACLLAAIAEVIGVRLSPSSLVHCVLKAEQMLTTGGGWQDQVGGIFGGAKLGRSKDLPLEVGVECLSCPEGFYDLLGSHLVLVYTGTARLARNLLQTVIRRWYARLPEIVSTAEALTANAFVAAEAIRRGDLESLGRCLSAYWAQKKCMAEGCEPELVANIFASVADLVYGCSLAGAGGGGFMVLLTRDANAENAIRERLQIRGLLRDHLTFHRVAVDKVGLTVELEK